MVMITLYAKQKKRHRCIEQTFGLHGRRQGWDVLREQHQNMYIIKGETDHQPRLDAWDGCSGLVHWEDPEGSGGEGGGRGIGMGNTCKSMADSCQCMAKEPLKYCKVISLQLIKINEKNKTDQYTRKKMLLASILQQNESAIHIHTHIFPPFGCRKKCRKQIHGHQRGSGAGSGRLGLICYWYYV